MGRRGAAAFALPSPAAQGCAALSDCPEGHLWDGTGEGESQVHVFRNIPWPAEPQAVLSTPVWSRWSLTAAP